MIEGEARSEPESEAESPELKEPAEPEDLSNSEVIEQPELEPEVETAAREALEQLLFDVSVEEFLSFYLEARADDPLTFADLVDDIFINAEMMGEVEPDIANREAWLSWFQLGVTMLAPQLGLETTFNEELGYEIVIVRPGGVVIPEGVVNWALLTTGSAELVQELHRWTTVPESNFPDDFSEVFLIGWEKAAYGLDTLPLYFNGKLAGWTEDYRLVVNNMVVGYAPIVSRIHLDPNFLKNYGNTKRLIELIKAEGLGFFKATRVYGKNKFALLYILSEPKPLEET